MKACNIPCCALCSSIFRSRWLRLALEGAAVCCADTLSTCMLSSGVLVAAALWRRGPSGSQNNSHLVYTAADCR